MSEPVAIAELAPAQANLPIETGDFHENLFSDEEDGPQGDAAVATTILREDDMVIEEDDQTNYNHEKPKSTAGNDADNNDGNSNAEGSAKEGSDDEKDKQKKKARSKSKRPKLDPVRLLNEKTGLPYLAESFPKYVKFKHGRGYESHNLRILLDTYDQWMDRLMPSMCLSDVVDTLERLGHKAAVKEYLLKSRVEQCLQQEQLDVKQHKELQDVEAADEYFENQPDDDLHSEPETAAREEGTLKDSKVGMEPDVETGVDNDAEQKQASDKGANSPNELAERDVSAMMTDRDGDANDDVKETAAVKAVITSTTGQLSTTNAGLVDEIEAMLAEGNEFQESLQ